MNYFLSSSPTTLFLWNICFPYCLFGFWSAKVIRAEAVSIFFYKPDGCNLPFAAYGIDIPNLFFYRNTQFSVCLLWFFIDIWCFWFIKALILNCKNCLHTWDSHLTILFLNFLYTRKKYSTYWLSIRFCFSVNSWRFINWISFAFFFPFFVLSIVTYIIIQI